MMEFNHYEKYIIESILNKDIYYTKITRDKVGISPDDNEAEPNKRIKAIKNILNELRLNIWQIVSQEAFSDSELIILAWSNFKLNDKEERIRAIYKIAKYLDKKLYVLRVTKDGNPSHPVYDLQLAINFKLNAMWNEAVARGIKVSQ